MNIHIILVQNKTSASCQALFARNGSEVCPLNSHKAVSSDNDKAVVYIDIWFSIWRGSWPNRFTDVWIGCISAAVIWIYVQLNITSLKSVAPYSVHCCNPRVYCKYSFSESYPIEALRGLKMDCCCPGGFVWIIIWKRIIIIDILDSTFTDKN